MRKFYIILLVVSVLFLYCGKSSPVDPDPANQSLPEISRNQTDSRYQCWGRWQFLIDKSHDHVTLIPYRDIDFHFNALKFLEDGPCYDCLNIESISPGAEPGTVEIDVTIRNPFPMGHLEYTAFDVKGILMFPATYFCATGPGKGTYPYENVEAPSPETSTYISWREWGDPEVLNPDGYSYRWSQQYMALGFGGDYPILQYWPGKYASGEPNAHINAHMNYYTHEQRHMFYPGQSVTRKYTVWLPPGPVVAAYAVEACWEPPNKTPVTNPAVDFPMSANQIEPYYFRFIVNNGEVITEPTPACCGWYNDGNTQRVEFTRWDGAAPIYVCTSGKGFVYNSGSGCWQCDTPPDAWCALELYTQLFSNGKHRMLASTFDADWQHAARINFGFTVYDFEIEL